LVCTTIEHLFADGEGDEVHDACRNRMINEIKDFEGNLWLDDEIGVVPKSLERVFNEKI
jgi:hypothetical protein